MNELKGYGLAEVNPIERRANSKIVAYNNRYFLVGTYLETQEEWLQMLCLTKYFSSGLITNMSQLSWNGNRFILLTISLAREILLQLVQQRLSFMFGEDLSY